MVIFLKIAKYALKSILIGIFSILIFNLIGQFFNLRLPFSILSIILIGFFRLPGFIILLLFLVL